VNRRDFVSVLLASVAGRGVAQGATDISVVVSPNLSPLENFAAGELSKYLHMLFPGCGFSVREGAPPGRYFIRLGSIENSPQLRRFVSSADLTKPDSYVVTTAQEGEASVGIMAGADPRATLYAVYALLEKLGLGFYLSYEAHPDPQAGPFAFDGWRLADAPLVAERILFNWHNFLSGCSGWDLSDWQSWIMQAAKMRFSSIMVHAYGNNPMFSFTHNGQTKPTGFLTSSARGRDWGNEHVNDVRRIYGGGAVFQDPVFGSSAARAPQEQAVEAATNLMKQVFAFAHRRGLSVNFALDVDTYSANPQNVIRTLPESACFANDKYLLPNPDAREGRGYYESQLRQLLGNYPEIDRIVLWFREVGSPWSPWRDLPVANFPQAWQTEYQNALAKTPSLENDRESPGLFAINKIARAFRACLDKMGKAKVQLAVGSWEFEYLRAADAFMAPEIAAICIHQWNALGKEDIQEAIRAVSWRRKVIPIPYAQDDDGHYAGRPYTPPERFASWLLQNGCAGFGILHWTTRPLDLYFKSLSVQVWKSSRDQLLRETCEDMAERSFGKGARSKGGRYLARWLTEAPMFGRETTDEFMDRPLSPPGDVIARSEQRLRMLEEMISSSLSAQGAKWVNYFRDWEGFVANFYRSHSAYERSVKAWKAGDLEQARGQLAQSKPEEVLEHFAGMANRAGITAGEKGLLISMNLRWLPYVVSHRQALGMDSVRWKFEPTEDEPLAQAPGITTFFIDRERRLWRGWGEKETGQPAVGQAGTAEQIQDSYLEVEKTLSLRLACIMGDPLPKGDYNVKLLFLPTAQQDFRVDLQLRGSVRGQPIRDRIDFRGIPRDNSGMIAVNHSLLIDQGLLEMDIKPLGGKALLCGVVLEPAGVLAAPHSN
jgi:hypothetical protein